MHFSWQRVHVCCSVVVGRVFALCTSNEVPFHKGCPANCSKQEYSCHSPGRVAGEASWRHVVVAVQRCSATLCLPVSVRSEAGINWCCLEPFQFGCLCGPSDSGFRLKQPRLQRSLLPGLQGFRGAVRTCKWNRRTSASSHVNPPVGGVGGGHRL